MEMKSLAEIYLQCIYEKGLPMYYKRKVSCIFKTHIITKILAKRVGIINDKMCVWAI